MSSLLMVKNLKKFYPMGRKDPGGTLRAVDGVSFAIKHGETLGLVGESGCGKSTAGRLIMRLLEATGGNIYYRGCDITCLSGRELRTLRRKMQIVFQDPWSSLNPYLTVEYTLTEPLYVHQTAKNKKEGREKAVRLLEQVGLAPDHLSRYPHQFSGGQRQRIVLARALALNPEFMVCDEPVSALDVSTQAQIINLLQDLQEQLNLTYLFIAHDLNVVRQISDRVAVMYLGKIVELADSKTICTQPAHPYTQVLLSAVPTADPSKNRNRIIVKDDLISSREPLTGCRFHPRCPQAHKRCRTDEPFLKTVDWGHEAACHLLDT